MVPVTCCHHVCDELPFLPSIPSRKHLACSKNAESALLRLVEQLLTTFLLFPPENSCEKDRLGPFAGARAMIILDRSDAFPDTASGATFRGVKP